MIIYKGSMILQYYTKLILYIIIYFVTLLCKTKESKNNSSEQEILQPLGVTKFSLRGNKNRETKTPL